MEQVVLDQHIWIIEQGRPADWEKNPSLALASCNLRGEVGPWSRGSRWHHGLQVDLVSP